MIRSIVWFKTDLRLHDNETLIRAIAYSDEIVPVYCFDENHYKTTDFGLKKTGNFRIQFLMESIIDLDKNLRELGSGLKVVYGKPEVEIIKIAQIYGVRKVFAKKEVAYEEMLTQELVEKELWKIQCEFETYSTSTLFLAQDLPFTLKEIPDVFTNFRKQVEKESIIRKVFEKPNSIKSPKIEPLHLPEIANFTRIKLDNRASFKFMGGESEGIKRIHSYIFETKSISTYKLTRNNLIGENYSSKFSAWLSLGCISARKIYDEIKKYETQYVANESTYWMVFELIWRDYFRFMMKKHRNQYFKQNGIKESKAIESAFNPEIFEKWKNGQTGNDFIDANMIELKTTGYMSNRGRQNVASYFCHNLKLDWRYGAAYFEEQLIDYDVSSNWGNWAYLAGVGNDPIANRVFNIEKQANDYDKNKTYRNLWLNKT
ncbi:MAG: DASH family cryptochrome [Bacteroidota bacterium]|nr:DASH family cryptochrome [Bacteroidota bacterium]